MEQGCEMLADAPQLLALRLRIRASAFPTLALSTIPALAAVDEMSIYRTVPVRPGAYLLHVAHRSRRTTHLAFRSQLQTRQYRNLFHLDGRLDF
jgi:hypothetical protein